MTGCMDPANLTKVNSKAVYYEVNSPLWSDGAAKSRAFVLPAGGKIHVKNCEPDAGSTELSTYCMTCTDGPEGPAGSGEWVFPIGTVMIKNFIFNGKLVETRLLMHVDDATAALIQNGTNWVGYTYMWNEAQTEAVIAPSTRSEVMFNTGTGTPVPWRYPSTSDCITCHTVQLGTLGLQNAQMNRTVNGANQIDTFISMGLFDTSAPKKPYGTPTVEPYANAALGLTGSDAGLDQRARSYLAANCSVCHRADIISVGFDLRYSLSLFGTGICNQIQQDGIPGMLSTQYVDLAPGDHANSAMYIRMNTAVPPSDPLEMNDVGHMPPLAAYTVDPQGVQLIGQWIDSIKACPDAGP
jgi:hypothetical protein